MLISCLLDIPKMILIVSIYYFYSTLFPCEWQVVIPSSPPPAASWLANRLRAWISLLVLLLSGLFLALHIDHQNVWIQLLIITWLEDICFRAAIFIADLREGARHILVALRIVGWLFTHQYVDCRKINHHSKIWRYDQWKCLFWLRIII